MLFFLLLHRIYYGSNYIFDNGYHTLFPPLSIIHNLLIHRCLLEISACLTLCGVGEAYLESRRKLNCASICICTSFFLSVTVLPLSLFHSIVIWPHFYASHQFAQLALWSSFLQMFFVVVFIAMGVYLRCLYLFKHNNNPKKITSQLLLLFWPYMNKVMRLLVRNRTKSVSRPPREGNVAVPLNFSVIFVVVSISFYYWIHGIWICFSVCVCVSFGEYSDINLQLFHLLCMSALVHLH